MFTMPHHHIRGVDRIMTTPPPPNNNNNNIPATSDLLDNHTHNLTDRAAADLPNSFFQFFPSELMRTTPPLTPPPTRTDDPEEEEPNNNPPPPPSTQLSMNTHRCLWVSTPPPPIEPRMIWTVEEARELANGMHLGPSSCGLVAVVNVLTSLSLPTPPSSITPHLHIHLRDLSPTAPLHTYLLSRSKAGTTAEELITAVERVTGGDVVGRFFTVGKETGPGKLGAWLAEWVGEGCTPVATLNPQKLPQPNPALVPDAWHHQMIHGVSGNRVHMTNPLESVSLEKLHTQLLSDSTLHIRREDVLARIHATRTDLRMLARMEDPRWSEMNVLGSTAHLLLEHASRTPKPTPHLAIPAAYTAGISLFTRINTPAQLKLVNCEDVI